MNDVCAYCNTFSLDKCLDKFKDGGVDYLCSRQNGHDGEHVCCLKGIHTARFWCGQSEPGLSHVDAVIEERGKVYGDPKQSHINIGLSWTAMIQQHYGINLDHPIPPEVVALMMVVFKAQRSARVYKEDNFVDMHAYAKFSEQFQQP